MSKDKDGKQNHDDDNNGYLVNDHMNNVYNNYTFGIVSTSIGATLCVHNYWHNDPMMLTIGLVLLAIGLFSLYQTKDKFKQRSDALTRGYFLRHPQPN